MKRLNNHEDKRIPWQYTLINNMFSKQEINNCSLSEMIDDDIYEMKKK